MHYGMFNTLKQGIKFSAIILLIGSRNILPLCKFKNANKSSCSIMLLLIDKLLFLLICILFHLKNWLNLLFNTLFVASNKGKHIGTQKIHKLFEVI